MRIATTKIARRGMTLVELLVVITIVVAIVALAAPIMRPQLKDRKLREASRQVNSACGVAKGRAAERNLSYGIWIKRDTIAGRTNGAYQVFYAQTPIPFAGETIGATATLTDTNNDGFADTAAFSDSQNLVQTGDVVQFNYKGPKYTVAVTAPSPSKTITFSSPSALPLPRVPGNTPIQLPFQITRQPVKASGAPLELPPGTVIDLQFSGVGKTGTEMDQAVAGATDIVIMFNPTGGVDRVYGFTTSSPGTINLLIGRVDQLQALQDNVGSLANTNLVDPTVSWVSIGHLTGTVTTAENYVTNGAAMVAATVPIAVAEARTIAVTKQTMGGR